MGTGKAWIWEVKSNPPRLRQPRKSAPWSKKNDLTQPPVANSWRHTKVCAVPPHFSWKRRKWTDLWRRRPRSRPSGPRRRTQTWRTSCWWWTWRRTAFDVRSSCRAVWNCPRARRALRRSRTRSCRGFPPEKQRRRRRVTGADWESDNDNGKHSCNCCCCCWLLAVGGGDRFLGYRELRPSVVPVLNP